MNRSTRITTGGKFLKIGALVGVVVLGIFYFVADPSTFRWMPKCVVYHLTGFQCPGCGSQRAIHALLHGHLGEAWAYNALFVAILPLFLFLGIVERLRNRHPALYNRVYSPPTILITALLIIAWTIFRNLP